MAGLGALPSELSGLRWPTAPRVTRTVTARTFSELVAAVSVAGTRVNAVGVTGGALTLSQSDVEILADASTRLGNVTVDRGVHRVRIQGGHYAGVALSAPVSYYPTHEVRAEWMVEDVWIEGVTVDSPDMALQLRGRRIAVTHSDVRAARYSVWSGDVEPFQSEDIILYDNVFDSAGPEATVRLVSVLRSVTRECRLVNTNKHNYRIHGLSDLNYASHNVLVNTGTMLGRMPGDTLGTVWFDDNVFHHTAPDLFNPDAGIARLIARDNTAYTSHGSFYGGGMSPGWILSGNTVAPYRPAP